MKTKYDIRKSNWRLWLLIAIALFLLACNGTGCPPWDGGGGGGGSQPAKPACEYRDDFSSYAVGSFPNGWNQFGSPLVKPQVAEVDGNKVLLFNLAEGGSTDKFAIYGAARCQAKSVTVRLEFQSNNDIAGLTVGYIGEADHIRIGLSPYADKLFLVEKVNNQDRQSREYSYQVEIGISYWLKVVPDYQARSLKAFISTDGTNFPFIGEMINLKEVEGQFGLTSYGFSPPRVAFDDFFIEGFGQVAPQPPTKKKAPQITVTSGTEVSEDEIWVNQETVRARFTIRNDSDFSVTLSNLLATGRGIDQDLGYADFSVHKLVKLAPTQEYTYEGEITSFSRLGRYRLFPIYLLPGEYELNPKNNSSWWELAPEVKVKVREQTGMEKRWSTVFLQNYGFNIKSGGVEWQEWEVNLLGWALETLPDSYRFLPSLKTVKRTGEAKDPAGYLPWQGTIAFSNSFFKEPTLADRFCDGLLIKGNDHFRGKVAHEFTHPLQRTDPKGRAIINPCTNPLVTEYAALTRWEIDPKVEKCSQDAEHSYHGDWKDLPGYSIYPECYKRARMDILEDMAEAARLYSSNPGKIKNNPRYEFLKEKIFHGKEY